MSVVERLLVVFERDGEIYFNYLRAFRDHRKNGIVFLERFCHGHICPDWRLLHWIYFSGYCGEKISGSRDMLIRNRCRLMYIYQMMERSTRRIDANHNSAGTKIPGKRRKSTF